MLSEKLYRWLLRRANLKGSSYSSDTPVALATDIGLRRHENQDRVAAMRVSGASKNMDNFIVAAVADGMGGMIDGEECASQTLATFFSHLVKNRNLSPPEKLLIAADAANNQVHSISKARGGATLSAVLIDSLNNRFSLNVGDSRIYITKVVANKATVERISVDDSLAEIMGGGGRDLIQFIGMGEGLTPHISKIPAAAKKVILTSDGAHYFRHETLCDLILSDENVKFIADRIITASRWFGSPDNASLACATFQDVSVSLEQADDKGVSVWDPFGTALILWTDPSPGKATDPVSTPKIIQTHRDLPTPSMQNQKSEHPDYLLNELIPLDSKSIQRTKTTPKKSVSKKLKSARKEKKPKDAESDQFSIEIIDRNDIP